MSNEILPIPKDNASAQLNASINASSTSIVLKAGEGANFPQPIVGQTTGAGSSVLLTETGVGASGVAVGDFIFNLTDSDPSSDSWGIAVVTAVNTNALTTTPLRGGSDNLWEASDKWVVKPFVINLSARTGGVLTGAVTKFEKVLITTRSVDTLTIPATTGYRGFDGTTPNSFDADDFVTIEVDQSIPDSLSVLVSLLFQNSLWVDGQAKMEADLDMDSNQIKNVSDPTDDQDAATKLWAITNFVAAEIADNLFRILGSSDATKKIAFEADELTTATTRTITMIDKDVDFNDFFQLLTAGEALLAGDALCIPSGAQLVQDSSDAVTNFGRAIEQKRGQVFLCPGYGGTLNSIVLSLKKNAAPTSDVFVKIYESDKTTLLGTSVNVSAAGLTTSFVDTAFPFSGGVTLIPGETYFLEVDTSSYDNTNYLIAERTSSDVYPFGDFWTYQTGPWVEVVGQDLYFKINFAASLVVSRACAWDPNLLDFIGYSQEVIALGSDFVIKGSGFDEKDTGMTAGELQYLSDVPGETQNSAGTNSVKVGRAITATIKSIITPPL